MAECAPGEVYINKLERDFQISKHHLIKLDNGLVSGNKPSSVALHQNHILVFTEIL